MTYPDVHECDAPEFDSKRDYCTQCTEDEYPDIDEQQLRLFRVKVHRGQKPRTVTEVMVLDVGSERAKAHAVEYLGAIGERAVGLFAEEIKGPFDAGYIVSHGDTT